MHYFDTITEYGGNILQSPEFHAIMKQKHHFVSTAGIHDNIRREPSTLVVWRNADF